MLLLYLPLVLLSAGTQLLLDGLNQRPRNHATIPIEKKPAPNERTRPERDGIAIA
jgi:hypothetical protein